jgi:hypothetical protein
MKPNSDTVMGPKPVPFRFNQRIRHTLNTDNPNALWHHSQGFAAEMLGPVFHQDPGARASLSYSMARHCRGFLVYAEPDVKTLVFRGWVIPRAYFERQWGMK